MSKQMKFDLGDAITSATSLTISRADKTVLSREQKRFNQIVNRIKKVRGELEKLRLAREELESRHMPLLLEAEKASVTARRDLVMAADTSPARRRLSKKQAKKLAQIMLEELAGLLHTSIFSEDAKLKELYQAYDPHHASFDEARAEGEEMARDMAADMFRDVFGVDVAPEDLDDEEKMAGHFQKVQEKEAAFRAEQTHGRPQKKQSKRQIEAAAKSAAVETALHKTTRQIYLDLVKHYHPDREQDETLRHEKTEWMKQITAAYEADDHLRLLELQMTLLSDRENAYAGFDEVHLKHFNQTLQRQLRELEMDLHFHGHGGLAAGPLEGFYHPDPRIMRQNVSRYIKEMETDAASFRSLAAAMQDNDSALSRWIAEYVFEEDAFDFPDGIF